MLNQSERETIILFDETRGRANVYTHNKRLKTRLQKLAEDRPEEMEVKHTGAYNEYNIPKDWIKINPPRKYTEEQRKEMADRLRAAMSPD